MSKEITIKDLSGKVDALDNTVNTLSNKVDKISDTVDSLSTTVADLSTTVTDLSATVDNLSKKMDKGFARSDANLEKLAVMVANGFADTARKTDLSNLEIRLGQRMDLLETKIETEVNRLDIRLDQMAPNFDVKDLKKRVTKVEKHLKFA